MEIRWRWRGMKSRGRKWMKDGCIIVGGGKSGGNE